MNRGKHHQISFRTVLVTLAVLICVGIWACMFLIPGDGPRSKSSSGSTFSLHNKFKDFYMPNSLHPQQGLPDWDIPFWTPIDVEVSSDPMVVLCKLNFRAYWERPHASPMFRDLEQISNCMGSNRKRERMSVLLDEIEKQEHLPSGRVIEPTGFVLHESRVGSTLIANFLASDPWSMVFSESTPIANSVLHCPRCSKEEQVQLFRNVMKLMGRSPIHKRLFVKFQSIGTTKIDVILEAFPETPWAFVFRQPVQAMMSHLDPKKGSSSAPCLRSKRNPPDEVWETVKAASNGERPTNEAWCAAHLSMLCSHAIRAYGGFNASESGVQRALLIDYESLPGIVPKALLPLFHVEMDSFWLEKMKSESKHYSKSRGTTSRFFSGDSKDKDGRATQTIQRYAAKILDKSFVALTALAIESVRKINPDLISNSENLAVTADWSTLRNFPANVDVDRVFSSALSSNEIPHSVALQDNEFSSSVPFASNHNSRTFSPALCPKIPDANYPKAFSMIDILNNWNADDTNIPPFHYDSLCHFDFLNETQREIALIYRARELPFVMFNIPELDATVKRWSDLDYLSKILGDKSYRTETSKSNHFMYWRGGSRSFLRSAAGSNWKPPTEVIKTKFADWLEQAVKGQNKSLEERSHQYFRVSSDAGNHFLFDELPFFKPKKSIFMVDPEEQRGIHCRFGMRSVIAEAHFDGSRNAVVMLGGMRRWILTHPDQCSNMHMLGPSHPSGRHSEVDWSNPNVKRFPNFAKVMGNEVILRPGDFLFVPTYWIHYIVSLNVNFQCNTRSGTFRGYDKFIKECGF